MPVFVVGFAVSLLFAGGFVWLREGLRWSATGRWSPITVNDFYVQLFGKSLRIGSGGINQAVVWIANIELGLVLFVVGLIVYIWVRRFSKDSLH